MKPYRTNELYIVGIGTSAGGLEAMLSMLPNLRLTGCVTYLIAQHMAHDGHSELTVGKNPTELGIIQHLFLVSLSSFYRDRASFRRVEQSLSNLIRAKQTSEGIRLWVPGCASGEEMKLRNAVMEALAS